MKCLYCGKRLALLRKLTDSEFCTDAHRHAYHREQEQLALARLSDSAKPKRKGKQEAEKPVVEPKDEPVFVDWAIRATAWSSVYKPEADPIPCEPVRFLPEGCVRFEAWPARAKRMPLAQPEEKVIAPAAIRLEVAPEAACIAACRPKRQEGQPATRLAGVAERVARLEPSKGGARATLLTAFGPLAEEHAPQLPVFGDGRIIVMPAASDVAVQLHTLETVMESYPAAAAQFGTKPVLSGLNQQLHVVESAIAHHETHPDAPMDLPGVLLALRRPEARIGKRSGRKVRPRELFFPLPRLGDLSSTASDLGGKNISVTPHPGVNGARWKPGQVPIRFRVEALNDLKGKGLPAFPPREADLKQPRHLPAREVVQPPIGMLGMAPRLDDISLFLAGDSAQDAPIRIAGEVSGEAMEAPVAKPGLWVWMPEPALCLMSELDRLSPPAVRAHEGTRQSGYQPFAAKAEAVSLPQITIGATPSALRADPRLAMTPIVVEAAAASTNAHRGGSLEFAITPPEFKATYPGSVLRREYVPVFARKVVPVASGPGIPYPQDTVAIQDLSPVWPEAEFLYPNSRNSVIEDSAMREAVKAMSALLLAEENRSIFSRLRIPSFSRGDSKWLVMSVPAILLLSLYLLTNNDQRPDIASLPKAEPVEIQHEPVAEPEPVKPIEKPQPVVAEKQPAAAKPVPAATAAVTAPASTGAAQGDEGFLGNIQQTIMKRAAVNLSDDFRAGLGDWEGEGDWSKQWSYDAAGFLHTGPLILYKPSLQLTDYRMEFLARIEKKSMGWVYRASDRKNYYAHRIVLTKGGPLPAAVVEHYAVINGKTVSLARRPLPMQVQADTSYRVLMDVRGNGFTLSVQGQVVDHWSDDRLKSGGIGFFSVRGEQASLRWVELSHQYDFLGRLCAFLAPYNLPAKEGSQK
ncbi:MAG: hypothetical protein JST93_11410 [Acidobacteria bacterium]|nr:hypothetical protein [Acidobacteriota bacterium]